MCLMAFDWQPDATTGHCLTLLGNRDEFHARATTGLCRWPDTALCGGRDLVAGGGWLVMHRAGALATLTNVRQLDRPSLAATISRGQLVTAAVRQAVANASTLSLGDWLEALSAGETVMARLAADSPEHCEPLSLSALDWCNLLVCDGRTLWRLHHGPDGSQLIRLPPGLHSLSNGHPDNEWPKQRRLRQRLAALKASAVMHDDDACLGILQDGWRPPTAQLPATGLALEREALLSSPFITSPEYGTRAATLVRWQRDDKRASLTLHERRFSPQGQCVAHRKAVSHLQEEATREWHLS
ncbi:NRDE family protein [Cobetia sp. 10Alg 146]|uniref:NRDE family protein n=1 Tax=Cobetia sp. 10Alg 146 TaxID=3040019 RepID=UPI00244BCA60|nr:NRDE family protein [Cobetia sp. 10Alg 146]MDH2291129.1 NRDE family protein [Cobetia sp. 10Alg 146]